MGTRNTTFAAALLAATAGGCTASTMLESTWKDPTFSRQPFERVAVVAMFDTVAENRTFEESAANELRERGVEAVPSYTILGERMYEEDELRAELADEDLDGILIYRMIAVDERNVYRNPTPYLRVPPGVLFGDPYYWYYYPRWNYYWYWRSTWDVTRSPGYWEPLAYVIVETSLFDVRTDRLVWTAKSATMDGARFDALADSVAERVTDELVAMRLVANNGGRTAAVR